MDELKLPLMAFADGKGKIYSHPFLRMAVACLDKYSLPSQKELITLPKDSTMFYLPCRSPVGFNPATGQYQSVLKFEGKKVFAVSAFLVPAYARLYHPAYITAKKKTLPLWAYTACGFYRGKFLAAAARVDRRIRQGPRFYDNRKVAYAVSQFKKQYPKNRLYKHLSHCALNYNCLAAKNLFLKRWEAPLPTSPACNSRCLGCLSYQEDKCIASHQRIKFCPSVDEITEVAVNHLKVASEAIVSFGQGCEGEPLLQAKTISLSIEKIRRNTLRGTINMNTNASLPREIELLSKAGMDSFRVSLNSVQPGWYNRYFRPVNYSFKDVVRSIAVAKKHNKFVAVNLLIFPGISDSAQEIKALIGFVKNTGIDMIQWRNLNIDPDYYLSHMPKGLRPQGVKYLIETIKKTFPKLKTGYFNVQSH